MKAYQLRLDNHLSDDYQTFRQATSKPYSHKDNTYPVVYLSENDFAILTLSSTGTKDLSLVVNLQNYYVYAFIIEKQCYAFDGLTKSLEKAGITVDTELPYGEAYYEIGSDGVEASVRQESVTVAAIISAITQIQDMSLSWLDKKPDILRLFWAMIEGIRFSGISDTVQTLLNSPTPPAATVQYDYFFYMAERWEKISIGNAYLGKEDDSIAVYDLRPLEYADK